MFGLGGTETVVLIIAAILLFGSQAPKLVGKFFNTTNEIKKEVAKGVDNMKDSTDMKK
jgi:Sec-independent protein translocase protein TatA